MSPVLQWSTLLSTALQQTLCIIGYHCALFMRAELKLSVCLTIESKLRWIAGLTARSFYPQGNKSRPLFGRSHNGYWSPFGNAADAWSGTPGVQSLYFLNKIRKLREFSFTSRRWKLLRGIHFIRYISHVTYLPIVSVTRTLWLRMSGWWWIMDRKWCARRRSWPNFGLCPFIFWKD